MQIVQRPIDELIFAEYNPRHISEHDYKALCDSLRRFECVEPVVVNQHPERKDIIVGGHMRCRAAKELGLTDIPCVYVELPLDREKELNIRLNRATGAFDFDLLANNFEVSDLLEWGFEESELSFELAPEEGLTDDDAIPEVKESICKSGELWHLGSHRLLCGDATKPEDVARLMQGEKADMVFTDPPYGIGLDTDYTYNKPTPKAQLQHVKGKTYPKVIGDDKPFDPAPLLEMFADVKEIFLWGGDYYHLRLPETGCFLVWDKSTDDADKMFGSAFEICWSKQKHKKEVARIFWRGAFGANADDGNRVHPTQKPVRLAEWFLTRWSKEGQLVLDLYLGSGISIIACEKLARRCYGMEISEEYASVIIQRWQEFTGKQATKA